MGMDWWLGRTPAQLDRKAKRRAQLDETRRRRAEVRAGRQASIERHRSNLTVSRSGPAAGDVGAETRHRERLDRIYRAQSWMISAELVIAGVAFAAVVLVVVGVVVFLS